MCTNDLLSNNSYDVPRATSLSSPTLESPPPPTLVATTNQPIVAPIDHHWHVARADKVIDWIRRIFPDTDITLPPLLELVESAYRSTDNNYGEAEAHKWAELFTFPLDVAERDSSVLESFDFDLAAMVYADHELTAPVRLSRSRVHACIPVEDPDFHILLELADGVEVLLPPDVNPPREPPPLRNKYRRLASVFNKLAYKQHQAGLVYIFRGDCFRQVKQQCRYANAHWTTKKGKHQGRALGDPDPSLNSDRMKVLCEEKWGRIDHPTLDRLVNMVLAMAEEHGWENIVLWKMDLKGAFTLLNIAPNSASSIVIPLLQDYFMVHHTGMFGWTGFPFAFNVLTRVIRRSLRRVCSGAVDMYVDDILGCCLRSEVLRNIQLATDAITDLLGPDAVEPTKTEWGRKMDWIGWFLDLDFRLVAPAQHNFLKAFHGIFSIDETYPLPYERVEALASWCSRYATVCRFLNPVKADLYRTLQGRKRREHVTLDVAAQECVTFWRCLFTLMELRNGRFARFLQSFAPPAVSYLLEYDSSLYGVGVVISTIQSGVESVWKVLQLQQTPFVCNDDSSFQNSMEFLGITIGLAALVTLGVRNASIRVRGDNTSSLQWALTERFRSVLCKRMSIIFISIGIEYDLSIEDAIHIAGVRNILCDQLSRYLEYKLLPIDLGFKSHQVISLDSGTKLYSLITFCDPTVGEMSEDDFVTAWSDAISLATSLVSE